MLCANAQAKELTVNNAMAASSTGLRPNLSDNGP